MTMFGAKQVTKLERSRYATGTDFCRIFEKDMDRLYCLSFLLTADHAMAEQCFVSGLEDSRNGNAVFKEWAQSWARRTIIVNAIRMIRPRPDRKASERQSVQGAALTAPAEIDAMVKLPAFERIVFVMSVLERFSDQECSLLLDCARADVIAARTNALRQIGNIAELQCKPASADLDEPLPEKPAFTVQMNAGSRLAASA
jgi:DNA-directed RNA polymerase specialized sigma24 family protein